MAIILSNNILQLYIQEPGKIYSGSRFDWTGQITQILYKDKHTFCSNETLDPLKTDLLGRGLYNEFGIDACIGYDDCPVDERFHKIGIGLLTKKSDEPYNFYKLYEVIPAEIVTQTSFSSVIFSLISKNERGYAYKLLKIITLCENSFNIWYELANIGDKRIQTNEYVHNFLSINNRLIDKDYILRFPFKMNPQDFGEILNPAQVVNIDSNTLKWKSIPDNQFFFSLINPKDFNRGSWALENITDKVGISETAHFEMLQINIWGSRHVVSPEIFFPIDLFPGQVCTWERKYEIFEL